MTMNPEQLKFHRLLSNRLKNLSPSTPGSVPNAELKISEEMNTVPTVSSGMELNKEEVITLYEYLQNQYIPYDNDNMMQLMRRIRGIYEFHTSNSEEVAGTNKN